MLGSNPGQLRLRHWLSDALATQLHLIHIRRHLIISRLHLIHSRLHLIHSRLISSTLGYISSTTRLHLIHNRQHLIHIRLHLIQPRKNTWPETISRYWPFKTCLISWASLSRRTTANSWPRSSCRLTDRLCSNWSPAHIQKQTSTWTIKANHC